MSNGDEERKWCRICHEEDLESFKVLESPCHCSGTLKFAHRHCIQRWCDEKGNTSCEICLQKFKPGYTYTAPAKKPRLISATSSSIRNEAQPQVEEIVEGEWNWNWNWSRIRCVEYRWHRRWFALLFTLVLLIKNLFDLPTQPYPFSLITVVMVKATGIIVPMYILFQIIAIINICINHQSTPCPRYEDEGHDYV